MKLRNLLLLINLLNHGLLVAALLYSYKQMLITIEQTTFLTIVACLAALISMLAYWLMTMPIIHAIQRLMHLTKQLSKREFQQIDIEKKGPQEFQALAQSLKEMGVTLEHSFKQLEDAEIARRELIANVSHDLRTPIAAIQSMLEAIQDGLITDQSTKERYLATSIREIVRLNRLIQDLFELSKLEAGQETFQPQLTHLDSVLIEVLDAHAVLLKNKNIQVELKIMDTLPALWIMPPKIVRVLSNLLQNAIHHSPHEGRIEIIAEYHNASGQIEVCITDEGEGIDPADHQRVFERFERTDYARNKESGGAGLGLAIAKSFITFHQGQIGVRTRPDGLHGSQFWFTLPRKPASLLQENRNHFATSKKASQ